MVPCRVGHNALDAPRSSAQIADTDATWKCSHLGESKGVAIQDKRPLEGEVGVVCQGHVRCLVLSDEFYAGSQHCKVHGAVYPQRRADAVGAGADGKAAVANRQSNV